MKAYISRLRRVSVAVGAAALLGFGVTTAHAQEVMTFVIADADPEVIANIERFHRRRHDLGVYWPEDD